MKEEQEMKNYKIKLDLKNKVINQSKKSKKQ